MIIEGKKREREGKRRMEERLWRCRWRGGYDAPDRVLWIHRYKTKVIVTISYGADKPWD